MSNNSGIIILLIAILLTGLLVAATTLSYGCSFDDKEHFFDIHIQNRPEQQVIALYAEIYNRQPNSNELSHDSRSLTNGSMTLDGMRQRMIDSPEYGNVIKMQSNSLTPELTQMLSDRDMLNLIGNVYRQECAKDIPSAMVLPLRDIYIYLDYNQYTLRALFRDANYPRFEKDLMNTPDLDNPQVMDAFNASFSKSGLVNIGRGIAQAEAYSASAPDGVAPSCKYDRSVSDADTDSCLSLTQVLDDAQATFNKNAAARALNNGEEIPDFNTDAARGDIRIPTHQGDMVLIPELAWTVPQYRAPVCTTLGQPLLTQPLSEEKNILHGTPLNIAAKNTRVGSIMPSFQHKEFVAVQQ